jgi:putative pyruvate formate lyase activating enzyme
MPDIKFLDGEVAHRLCGARDYPDRVREAVREMYRQVGDLTLDPDGVARRGLLIRHLVLPGGLAQTRRVMDFLAQEISRDTYVNVMDQYRPCGEAHGDPDLSRRITREEYRQAVEATQEAGLHRLDRRIPFRIFRQ